MTEPMDASSKYEFYESFRAPRYYDFAQPEDPCMDEFFNSFQDLNLLDADIGETDRVQKKKRALSESGKKRNSAGTTSVYSHCLRGKPEQQTKGPNPRRELLRPSAAHNATVKSTRRYASEPPALYKASRTDENAPGDSVPASKVRPVASGTSRYGAVATKAGRKSVSQNKTGEAVADKKPGSAEARVSSEAEKPSSVVLPGGPRSKSMAANAHAGSAFLRQQEAALSQSSNSQREECKDVQKERKATQDTVVKPHRQQTTSTRTPKPRTASCPSKAVFRDAALNSGRAASAQRVRSEDGLLQQAKAATLEKHRRKSELNPVSRSARVAKPTDHNESLFLGIRSRLQRSTEQLPSTHRGSAAPSARPTQLSGRQTKTSGQMAINHKFAGETSDNSNKQGLLEKLAKEEAGKPVAKESKEGRHRRSESAPRLDFDPSSLILKTAVSPKRSSKIPVIPVSPKLGSRIRTAPGVASVSMNESMWQFKNPAIDHQAEERNLEAERLQKVLQYRALRASVIRSKVPPTVPKNVVLNIDKRAAERSTFDAQLAEQRRQAEEHREERKRQQELQEAEEIRRMRMVDLIPIAQRMPLFEKMRPFKPQRSTKPATKPVSPKLGRRDRPASNQPMIYGQ